MNISPINNLKVNQARELEKMFEASQVRMREVIDSVHSKTLDKLYTDEFRPEILNANKTTVISLKTGEPIPVNIDGPIVEGKVNGNHRRRYTVRTEDDKTQLGYKTFGIKKKNDEIELTPGYIYSSKNDDYSGTQIRLLQLECEFAKEKDVNKIPLIALFPALKFHTMMGFRPVTERSFKMYSKEDLKNASDMFSIMYRTNKFYQEDIVPIFSKVDGEIYFDRNKTIFHAVMKDNERTLSKKNQRHLDLTMKDFDNDVSMSLEGEEFDKWQSRLKGFEILSKDDAEPRKSTFMEKLRAGFNLFH